MARPATKPVEDRDERLLALQRALVVGRHHEQMLGFDRRSDRGRLISSCSRSKRRRQAPAGGRTIVIRRGSAQGRRRAWRGSRRQARPRPMRLPGAVQNNPGQSREAPQARRHAAPVQDDREEETTASRWRTRRRGPMMANTAICLRPGKWRHRQRRVADQKWWRGPQADRGHHIGEPLSSAYRGPYRTQWRNRCKP